MSTALYRKYRPQTFAEVVGQDAIKTILKNAINLGRVSHAYLFCGPRGVGKTTIARILAKAVNCQAPKAGEPDGTCDNCRMIAEGRFLDLIEIDAASYTGVDNIRDIIEHVKFHPSSGKYKVFIIDEVHMLSKAAFNALLKTLEEPPSHAIFILATTEIQKVPATIISRSQRFDFRKVSVSEILTVFETVIRGAEIRVPLEAQKLIAHAAEGSFRDALSILDQIASFSDTEITVEEAEEILGLMRGSVIQKFMDLIISRDQQGAVRFIRELAESGKDLTQFTRHLLDYLRLIILTKLGTNEGESALAAEEQEKLQSQSSALPMPRVMEIVKYTLEAYRNIKLAPVPELPLLVAIMSVTDEGAAKQPAMPSVAPASVTVGTIVNLDLGTVMDRWAEVLSKTKDYNHSLISSLRLGRIVRLEGQDLILAFPYNFHRDVIDARKNRIIIEQVLGEIFSQPLRIKVVLEREENGKAPAEKNDLVNEALKILGNQNE